MMEISGHTGLTQYNINGPLLTLNSRFQAEAKIQKTTIINRVCEKKNFGATLVYPQEPLQLTATTLPAGYLVITIP